MLLGMLLSMAAAGMAEDRCPWLNAATAAGVLGGPVTNTSLKLSTADGTGTCDFEHSEGAASSHLIISVEPVRAAKPSPCGSRGTPLTAIGNEAVTCAYEGKAGETGEQVTGRVRDHAFLVRLSTNDKSALAAALRERARQIAEQVAGILF
jgi:hypothetical protein